LAHRLLCWLDPDRIAAMKIIPELPGRAQRVLDLIFRLALLLLMAGVAVHAVSG
jgi:hypothetical protein